MEWNGMEMEVGMEMGIGDDVVILPEVTLVVISSRTRWRALAQSRLTKRLCTASNNVPKSGIF